MNDAECIATLRVFLGADNKKGSLNHVCYKHLGRLGGHIGMQIKTLNAAGLRARLVQCWDQRADNRSCKSNGPGFNLQSSDCIGKVTMILQEKTVIIAPFRAKS